MPNTIRTSFAECRGCGKELPVAPDPPLPCPECGSLRKRVSGSAVIPAGATITVTGSSRSNNDARSRLRKLGIEIDAVEASVGAVSAAQDATKVALDVLHELNDCAKRGEWSNAHWDAGTRGIWNGLMGARNASHHKGSPIVESSDALRWEIDKDEIATLKYPDQAEDYAAHVAGRRVLPMLRTYEALLREAIGEPYRRS